MDTADAEVVAVPLVPVHERPKAVVAMILTLVEPDVAPPVENPDPVQDVASVELQVIVVDRLGDSTLGDVVNMAVGRGSSGVNGQGFV